MFRRSLSLLLGAGSLLAALLLTAEPSPSASTVPVNSLRSVRVAEVGQDRDVRDLRLRGLTRSARRAQLSFLVGGRLVERRVELGDTVKRGELLARLDDRELRNAVAAAEARRAEAVVRFDQAGRDLERVEGLAAAKAATVEELERARSAVDGTRAGLEAAETARAEARRLLGEVRIEAPYDAIVTEAVGEPGERVSAGVPVITLSGEGEVEVEVELPASVALQLEVGQAVEVDLPMQGIDPLAGKVRSVGRTASGPGRLFPIVVDLPKDAPAVAGLAAEVVVTLDRGTTLAVPVEAVIDPGGRRSFVFRVVDDRVEKVAVRVEALREDRVAVSGDLAVGDLVVIGGQRGLLDGEQVEVLP